VIFGLGKEFAHQEPGIGLGAIIEFPGGFSLDRGNRFLDIKGEVAVPPAAGNDKGQETEEENPKKSLPGFYLEPGLWERGRSFGRRKGEKARLGRLFSGRVVRGYRWSGFFLHGNGKEGQGVSSK